MPASRRSWDTKYEGSVKGITRKKRYRKSKKKVIQMYNRLYYRRRRIERLEKTRRECLTRARRQTDPVTKAAILGRAEVIQHQILALKARERAERLSQRRQAS